MKCILTLAFLLICVLKGFTATYYVNDNSTALDIYTTAVGNDLNTGLTPADPFETLGAAISASSSGDIILVDAGTYADLNLTIPNTLNNLTISGASISTTIFDPNGATGLYLFMTVQGHLTSINNMTIQNYESAGAIDLIGSSATDSTTLTLSQCFFDHNETSGGFDANPHGGAIYIGGSGANLPPVLISDRCQFSDNLAQDGNGGGAIYSEARSRLQLYGSRFVCNNSRAFLTTYEGGAIFMQDSYGSIDSCYFAGSPVFDQQGGAIRAINGSARLTISILNTIFTDNTARQGSAVYMEDNLDCNIINSLIFANTITGGFGDGGSINCNGSVNMYISNSTIADNLSTHASDGGGLADDGSLNYEVYNSIIWNNQVSNVRSATITATYSDIEPVNDNHSGVTGNIITNPLFNATAGDYTLQGTSLAINAGNTFLAPTVDLTNLTRIGNPDMGCFENGAVTPLSSSACSIFIICVPPTILGLTADATTICENQGTNINIAGSEVGIFYQLINDFDNSNVGSPVLGTGGIINLPTGNLTSTTNFSVEASQVSDPSCISTLGPITITVNPLPVVTISSTSVCADGSVTVSPTTGGTWVSSDISVATITSGGVITVVADGTVAFTFTDASTTCTASTSSLTISPLPIVSISATTVCQNGSVILTPTTGGSWISNNTSVATVTAGGIVTLVADGIVDFTFTDAATTCSATTASLTVNANPTVSISSTVVCADGSVTVSPTSGGTWVSSDISVATITSGGVVTVVADGTVAFTFTDASTTCASTTSTLTVSPLPVVSISATTVCQNGSVILTPTTGGSWISNNTSVATVTVGGIVTLVADGIVDFTFTDAATTCSATTASLTVNANPTVSISSTAVCVDGSVTISPTSGGTWVSNDASVATITSGGVVTLVTDGIVDFTFTDATTACTATTNSLTVNPLPIVSVSSSTICQDGSLTLSPLTGGSWVSNNTSVATVTSAGIVSLLTDGSVTFTFTDGTTGCSSTTSSVTVDALPTVTVSSTSVCENGSLTVSPLTGGTWVSNNPSVATITSAGIITIVADGSVDFTFTDASTTCAATTASVSVFPLPTISASTNDVCLNGSLTLSPNTGGNWISNNTAVATVVSATGMVNLIDAGSVTFTFTESTNGCSSNSNTVTVNPLPIVSVSSNSVCTDGSLLLTPTSGGTWISNNTAIATVTSAGIVTIVSSGSVTFTFTDAVTTCESITSSVTINALPSVSAANNGPVCDGTTLSLIGGSGGLTYSWTGPNSYTSTSASPTVSLAANSSMGGVYSLTVSDGTCSNAQSTTVTVNALPSIDVTGVVLNSPSSCGGTDGSITGITASGSPTLQYSWNGGLNQLSPDLNLISAGSYSVLVTDGNGCSQNAGPFVLSDPTPPAQPTITLNPSAVCLGGSFTITVDAPDPSATYAWNGPGGYANTGTSISFTNITGADAGNYTVTPTIAGCTGGTSLPAVVVVNNLPIVDVLTPIDVDCNNPSISLDGSNSEQGSNITFDWSTSSGNLSGGVNTDVATADESGLFTLVVTNTTTGCIDSASVSVSVDTLAPVPAITSGTIYPCGAASFTLDGSSSSGVGLSYSWTGTNSLTNANTSMPTIASPGAYMMVVTGANGCQDSLQTAVVPDSNLPIANAGANDTVDCQTPFPFSLDGTGSDIGANFSYFWTTNGSGNITAATALNPTIDGSGIYVLVVTNTSNNCESQDTVNIVTDTIVPVILTVGSELIIDCNNAGVATLTGVNSTGIGLNYNWNTINGLIDSQNIGVAQVSAQGDYVLTVTGANGCLDSVSIFIAIDTVSPIVSIVPPTNIGCGLTTVSLDGSATTGAGVTFLWSDGDVNAINTVNTAGTYVLTATSSNGCSASDSVVVNLATPPTADFTATPILGDVPLNVNFIDQSAGTSLTYDWDFDNGNFSTTQNPSETFSAGGAYTVILTVTDDNGCVDTASLVINVNEYPVIIPNVFSPNDDNENETFYVTGQGIKDMELIIYNRWGQRMVELQGSGASWDGRTMAGVEVPEATYYYIIQITDYLDVVTEYTGYLMLIR
jgi:gliding motility-associated-like protein